jgi:hypothetical protein
MRVEYHPIDKLKKYEKSSTHIWIFANTMFSFLVRNLLNAISKALALILELGGLKKSQPEQTWRSGIV